MRLFYITDLLLGKTPTPSLLRYRIQHCTFRYCNLHCALWNILTSVLAAFDCNDTSVKKLYSVAWQLINILRFVSLLRNKNYLASEKNSSIEFYMKNDTETKLHSRQKEEKLNHYYKNMGHKKHWFRQSFSVWWR